MVRSFLVGLRQLVPGYLNLGIPPRKLGSRDLSERVNDFDTAGFRI